MSTRIPALAAIATALWALGAAPAAAQQHKPEDDSYFAAKLQLGVAGNVEAGAIDMDAEVSYGAALGYMHPLHRYFVLGAELGAQSWQTEPGAAADADRNLLFDLVLVPQVRLPLAGIVEPYLSFPIGLTLDFLNAFDGVEVPGLASADIDPAVGFTFSVLVGARFTLTGSLGLLAELGYSLHSFSHQLDAQAAGIAVGNVDLDVDIEQLVLRAGLYF